MNARQRHRLEAAAHRWTVWLVAGMIGTGAMVVAVTTIAGSYADHLCDAPPHGWVRNHEVRERPTCRDGELTITVRREDADPSMYGWNCYIDGDGVCGTAGYVEHEPFCLTDELDGYTMCQDGRVYVRVGDIKLDPVVRDPAGDPDTGF